MPGLAMYRSRDSFWLLEQEEVKRARSEEKFWASSLKAMASYWFLPPPLHHPSPMCRLSFSLDAKML